MSKERPATEPTTEPTTDPAARGPLAGFRVVEVAIGAAGVGNGPAASLPGAILRDFGAHVRHLDIGGPGTLDAGVEYDLAWHHGKELVELTGTEPLGDQVRASAATADVVLLVGSDAEIEAHGLEPRALVAAHPRLVVACIRPGADADGPLDGYDLLVQARTGFMTQVPGARPGPHFCSVPLASAGAALVATAGALALLHQRERTGLGGWVETSLLDGLFALVPMIVGRIDHPTPASRMLWEQQGPTAEMSHRCADGAYVQLWFGAKGAYEEFLECIGDPPTELGYNAEMTSDVMGERSRRWATVFATRDRAHWLAAFRDRKFRCDPVLRPGELLAEPHLRETALSVDVAGPDGRPLAVLGAVGRVAPVGAAGAADGSGAGALLSGTRVVDLSAYLAGPTAARVLAGLGADVVKVEPATGDVHRALEPLFAAGQRGKRTVALDLKSEGAGPVLAALFAWADVVHHNSRLGLADRLGYDEAAVRRANPHAVYNHASGFGVAGPWASHPSNDYVMQALTGMAASLGGVEEPPVVNSWGAIDVAGGWLSACSIIAALVARHRTGRGQTVSSSLIGAGLALRAGTFIRAGEVVEGPVVDAGQTGLGAAYRIYQGSDGAWLAIAVPDGETWSRLVDAVAADGVPDSPPSLRRRGEGEQPEEHALADRFGTAPAADWVTTLREARVPVEPVLEVGRAGFADRFLDDPVNRALGRVAIYDWGERGTLGQQHLPYRFGPEPARGPVRDLPRLGEHTDEVLAEVGVPVAASGR